MFWENKEEARKKHVRLLDRIETLENKVESLTKDLKEQNYRFFRIEDFITKMKLIFNYKIEVDTFYEADKIVEKITIDLGKGLQRKLTIGGNRLIEEQQIKKQKGKI